MSQNQQVQYTCDIMYAGLNLLLRMKLFINQVIFFIYM